MKDFFELHAWLHYHKMHMNEHFSVTKKLQEDILLGDRKREMLWRRNMRNWEFGWEDCASPTASGGGRGLLAGWDLTKFLSHDQAILCLNKLKFS